MRERSRSMAVLSIFTFALAVVGTLNTTIEGQSKVNRPEISSRKKWSAKKPVGEGKKHKLGFITIHHTATRQKPDVSIVTKMQNLQEFSQRDDKLDTGKFKPAWFDIPY